MPFDGLEDRERIQHRPPCGDIFIFWEDYVTVSYLPGGGLKRDDFRTQVSITGYLEFNPDREMYRVINSEGDFAYFKASDVRSLLDRRDAPSKTGAVAVIYLD